MGLILDERGNRKWIHQDKQLIDNFVVYQAKVSYAVHNQIGIWHL